jgi:hypothetical protein
MRRRSTLQSGFPCTHGCVPQIAPSDLLRNAMFLKRNCIGSPAPCHRQESKISFFGATPQSCERRIARIDAKHVAPANRVPAHDTTNRQRAARQPRAGAVFVQRRRRYQMPAPQPPAADEVIEGRIAGARDGRVAHASQGCAAGRIRRTQAVVHRCCGFGHCAKQRSRLLRDAAAPVRTRPKRAFSSRLAGDRRLIS